MPGAIIPDDWDGSTYECLKIQWPSSPLWRALLFGQVSEPGTATYWDPSTGDEEAAAVAAARAYGQTISQEELGCEEGEDCVIVPASSFAVVHGAQQQIQASTWTPLIWNSYAWNNNNPGFDLPNDRHSPVAASRAGFWYYNVGISLQTVTTWNVALTGVVSGNIVYLGTLTEPSQRFSTIIPITNVNDTYIVQIYTLVTLWTSPGWAVTDFRGTWLGPVA